MSDTTITTEDRVGDEPLNTVQLNAILSKRLPGNFIGVFSSDLIPDCRSLKGPWSLCLNLDCSHRLGSHWQSWIKTSTGVIHHFCSYGLPPETTEWLNFLKTNSRNGHWVMQRRKIQSEFSPFCGHYSIYFTLMRNRTPLDVSDTQIMKGVNDGNIVEKLNRLLRENNQN